MSEIKTKKAKTANEPVVENEAPKVKTNSDLTNALLVILGAVAAVVLLVFVYPYLTSLFGKQKEVFTNVEQLGQRHLELEATVAQLQKQLSERPDGIEKLQSKIDALEEKLKLAEQDSVGSGVDGMKETDKADADALNKRLDEVEAKLSYGQERMAKLPETIHHFEKLTAALQTSKPFDVELQASMQLFDPLDPKIQKLLQTISVSSKTGVPTADDLRKQFKDVVEDIRQASIPEDWPWYSKLTQRAANLFVVSKKDATITSETPIEDVFLKVRNLLERNNLDEAVLLARRLPEFFAVVQKNLQGNAQQKLDSAVYSEWMASLEKRLIIQQSLPLLEAHVLAYLLTGQGPQIKKEGNS